MGKEHGWGWSLCTELLSCIAILINLFVKDGDGLTGAPTYLQDSFLHPVPSKGLEESPKMLNSSVYMKLACFFLDILI